MYHIVSVFVLTIPNTQDFHSKRKHPLYNWGNREALHLSLKCLQEWKMWDNQVSNCRTALHILKKRVPTALQPCKKGRGKTRGAREDTAELQMSAQKEQGNSFRISDGCSGSGSAAVIQ